MRQQLSFVFGAFGCALILLAFKHGSNNRNQPAETKKVLSCSPDWKALDRIMEETEIPPVPGAGNYSWKISTDSDSAQFYFNQGINMYYSFHIIEAMASFKKATKFDPDAAMLYWAQALAYGPNINDLGYAASPDALQAIERAMELGSSASELERELILAQGSRYSYDSSVSREYLNGVYADMMKKLYEAHPGHADVAALFADALMLQHPWDLWTHEGTPRPWTPQIRDVLEKMLAQTPEHPGANHYYIHVMEPSPFYQLALPSADLLGSLTPGLSHTVHMPSHIYLRAGKYDRGSSVNEDAVAAYQRLIPMYSPVTGNAFLYAIHNLHMQTNNSLLAGRYDYSRKAAAETRQSIPVEYLDMEGPLANYIQYIYATPLLVDVKFGKWEDVLAAPKPESRHTFLNVIYHFARGMAYSAKKSSSKAKLELAAMELVMQDSSLRIPMTPFSAAIESARVGHQILTGTIALREKDHGPAITAFREAVRIEEAMVYNEPRDWMLNPGQYLGNALYVAKRYDEALAAFEKDLLKNNENPWSLYGLWQVYKEQKNSKEAEVTMRRLKKARESSDVEFKGAVY